MSSPAGNRRRSRLLNVGCNEGLDAARDSRWQARTAESRLRFMNARVDQLLTDALDLPADERSALVVALLDSLEGSTDAAISDAWREELRQRRQALRDGTLKPVPWAEARARLSAL